MTRPHTTGPAPLNAWVRGIGLIGPGLPGWSESVPILTGARNYSYEPAVAPAATALPAAERRRVGVAVRMALAAGLAAAADAGAEPRDLATVFASSSADGDTCHAICEMLASPDRQISPTRFHNSVHNAPAGYWGIATGAMAPANVLCSFDASMASGLLEALAMLATGTDDVLLIAYDAPYPEPLRSCRPELDTFGIGMLLSRQAGARHHGRISAVLGDAPVTTMADPGLEALRRKVPTARGLPLLAALARPGAAPAVVIDYLSPLRIQLQIAP